MLLCACRAAITRMLRMSSYPIPMLNEKNTSSVYIPDVIQVRMKK